MTDLQIWEGEGGALSKPTTDFTFENFKKFVAEQPRGEVYNPWDGRNCALAQFAAVCFPGEDFVVGFYSVTMQSSGDYFYLSDVGEKNEQLVRLILKRPFNFGALCQRLATVTKETP